jgi:uncharacterized phage protein (TIGR01671 family)
MREIRFRDYDTKQLRYFDLDTYDRAEHDSYGNIMQYIGFKDKTGKEIYDGDIVNDGYMIYEVKYIEFLRNTSNAQLRRLTVIGNIYENENLLTK